MLHLLSLTTRKAFLISKAKVFMEPKRGNNDLINFNMHDISFKVPTATTRTGMNKYFCDAIPWACV